MEKMKRLFKLLTFVSIFSILSSCSSNGNVENPKDALSAFLYDQEDIVTFGNLNVEDLLLKSDAVKVPKFGNFIQGELDTWKKGIDFDTPVYYAVQGPFTDDGEPESVYGFVKILDKQTVLDKMILDGYDFDEVKGVSYTEDGEFIFGLNENIGIFVVQKNRKETDKIIAEAFKKIKGKKSNDEVESILENEGDLVVAMNVQSIYSTSFAATSNLSKEKEKELNELLKDAYIQTVFKFEDGAAIIETKNIFSAQLKDKLFFNADKNAPINNYLGSGTPRMGFSMNFDMKKMNHLINEYSPEAISNLARSIGPQAQIALMFSGKDGLAAFLDGRIGAVVFGDFENYNGETPELNAFVGLTEKGKEIVTDFSSNQMKFNGVNFIFGENGLMMNSQTNNSNDTKKMDLSLPEGCEKFGQSALSFFLNLDGVNMDNLKLEGEANVLRAVKYITFDYTNEGGVLYIKAKKGQENILKQALEILIEEVS